MWESGHSQRSVTIEQIVMRVTGTFDDQFYRPYESNFDGRDATMFGDMTRNSPTILAGQVAGIAGTVCRPSAQVLGGASIPNGWGERRIRFMMRVSLGDNILNAGGNTEILTGYTDFAGVTATGNLDPEMRLYFNNSLTIRNTPFMNQGTRAMQSLVSDASQLIMPIFPQPQQPLLGSFAPAPRFDLMTPMNVVNEMTSTRIGEMDNTVVLDLRNGVIDNQVRKSRRSNGLATEYLSRTINALHAAERAGIDEPARTDDKILSEASYMLQEPPLSSDRFMSFLERTTTFSTARSVAWGELAGMFPGLETITKVLTPGKVEKQTDPMRGQGEYWHTATNETVAATVLANAVPAIMMDLMLTDITFSVTNETLNGQVEVDFKDVRSFAQGVDLTPYIMRFRDRMIYEVIADLTMRNMFSVSFNMKCDVLGNTHIWIRLNGGPETYYVLPSFCDALFSPVITPNHYNLQQLAKDISFLAEYTKHASAPASTIYGFGGGNNGSNAGRTDGSI